MSFRIGQFQKVSLETFISACKEIGFPEEAASNMYFDLELPVRATAGSAGYDFHIPFGTVIAPGQTIVFPTGIRCYIEPDWVLVMAPRSGLGFKYKLQLDNTIGIIDSDYFYSDNEGQISIKMTNHSDEELKLCAGDRVAQAMFLPYGITIDDNVTAVRNGGYGRTGN